MLTGVELTAVRVAAARAIETRRGRGLVDDPFAEAFVRAAAPDMPTRLDDPSLDDEGRLRWSRLANLLGARSAFYDAALSAATGQGIDQVVIVAAGLDARAFRLGWPPGCHVYEIDRPEMIEFKNRVALGSPPRCLRHTIGVDLREDWTRPLADAGFDAARRTAWLVEGLLPYLPAAAEESLFDRVHELSPAGSRIAFDRIRDIAEALRRRSGLRARRHWNTEPRRDPAAWLTAAGWTVTTVTSAQLGRCYLPSDAPPPGRHGEYLTAERA